MQKSSAAPAPHKAKDNVNGIRTSRSIAIGADASIVDRCLLALSRAHPRRPAALAAARRSTRSPTPSSRAGRLTPLNRSAASARSLERLHYEEELFGVRGIRHCFRARRNLSLAAWQALARPILSAGSHDKHANHRPLLWLLAPRQHSLANPALPMVPARKGTGSCRARSAANARGASGESDSPPGGATRSRVHAMAACVATRMSVRCRP